MDFVRIYQDNCSTVLCRKLQVIFLKRFHVTPTFSMPTDPLDISFLMRIYGQLDIIAKSLFLWLIHILKCFHFCTQECFLIGGDAIPFGGGGLKVPLNWNSCAPIDIKWILHLWTALQLKPNLSLQPMASSGKSCHCQNQSQILQELMVSLSQLFLWQKPALEGSVTVRDP